MSLPPGASSGRARAGPVPTSSFLEQGLQRAPAPERNRLSGLSPGHPNRRSTDEREKQEHQPVEDLSGPHCEEQRLEPPVLPELLKIAVKQPVLSRWVALLQPQQYERPVETFKLRQTLSSCRRELEQPALDERQRAWWFMLWVTR